MEVFVELEWISFPKHGSPVQFGGKIPKNKYFAFPFSRSCLVSSGRVTVRAWFCYVTIQSVKHLISVV